MINNNTLDAKDKKKFYLEIDNSSLPLGVFSRHPYSLTVTIEDDECKYNMHVCDYYIILFF